MRRLSIRVRLWLMPVVVAVGLLAILAAGLVANRAVESAITVGIALRADRDAVTDAWFAVQQIRSSLLEGLAAGGRPNDDQMQIVRANLDFVQSTAASPAERAGRTAEFEQAYLRLRQFLEGGLAEGAGVVVDRLAEASAGINTLFLEEYHEISERLEEADRDIRSANQRLVLVAALAGGSVLAILLAAMALLIRSIVRPLDATMAGFARVAAGDLGHQIAEAEVPEFERMTHAFNELSLRLRGMFDLIERIGRGSDLAETMSFIHESFNRFVPVDGSVLLIAAPDGLRFVVESSKGEAVAEWSDLADPLLSRVVAGKEPVIVETRDEAGKGPLGALMAASGMATSLLVPMGSVRDGGAILLIASREASAYGAEDRQFLANMASQLDSVLSRTLAMEGLVVAAVQGLAKLAESRDPETGDHLVRMSLYSAFLAEEMALDDEYRALIDAGYVRAIHRFAPMHDIGKVGVADSVLLKPGRLDDTERLAMNVHPVIGGEVLRLCEQRMNELGRSVFKLGIEIAESHHEKWDGSGYPAGLSGPEIPLSARIVAVADVFDALTSKRPYKAAFGIEQALDIIRGDAGAHFDPEVVDALGRALPRMLGVYERMKHV